MNDPARTLIFSVPTSFFGSGFLNCASCPSPSGISIGSLAPSWMIILPTRPALSFPGATIMSVSTFPPTIAIIPPSIDVSIVLPAAPRATSAMREVIGGLGPNVTSYSAQLPTGTFSRSTATGIGGPCPGCWASAAVEGERERKGEREQRDEARHGSSGGNGAPSVRDGQTEASAG